MKILKEEIEFWDLEQFKQWEWYYEFPLDKILDDRYGRIQCNLEIHKTKKQKWRVYITEFWFWFSKTKEEKYYWKVFKFECFTESFYMDKLKISMIKMCEIHNKQVIIFYPDNEHKKLLIDTWSSITNNIEFK